jgi:hypothetical protein
VRMDSDWWVYANRRVLWYGLLYDWWHGGLLLWWLHVRVWYTHCDATGRVTVVAGRLLNVVYGRCRDCLL